MHDFEPGLLPWSPPFTLGHENAGWVHALGAGVTGLEPASPSPSTALGLRHAAHAACSGMENYCERPDLVDVPGGGGGLGLDGGMADFLLVPAAPPAGPAAGRAGAGDRRPADRRRAHAVPRRAPVLGEAAPGSTAVVIGVGGLGHLAVQILRATTAARVLAVDTRPEARELALGVGADLAVAPDDDAVADPAGDHRRPGGRRGARLRRRRGHHRPGRGRQPVPRRRHRGRHRRGDVPLQLLLPALRGVDPDHLLGHRPELVEVLDLAARGCSGRRSPPSRSRRRWRPITGWRRGRRSVGR